jgi:hypothetical protein
VARRWIDSSSRAAWPWISATAGGSTCTTPEDILLQKLRWYRRGGEVSDRQWRDILAIVRIQGDRLDRPYLARNAKVLAVSNLLVRALKEGTGEEAPSTRRDNS